MAQIHQIGKEVRRTVNPSEHLSSNNNSLCWFICSIRNSFKKVIIMETKEAETDFDYEEKIMAICLWTGFVLYSFFSYFV